MRPHVPAILPPPAIRFSREDVPILHSNGGRGPVSSGASSPGTDELSAVVRLEEPAHGATDCDGGRPNRTGARLVCWMPG
jgi:hypothetical protein